MPGELEATVERINAQHAAEGRPPFQIKTVPQGAATSVWAAFVAPAEEIGGRFCEDCQVSQVADGLISPVSPGVRPYAFDPEPLRRSGPGVRSWSASASDTRSDLCRREIGRVIDVGDKPGLGRLPTERRAGPLAQDRTSMPANIANQPKCAAASSGRLGDDRNVQAAADHLCDRLELHVVFGDGMERATGGAPLECQP
jgi:hypothetical protein